MRIDIGVQSDADGVVVVRVAGSIDLDSRSELRSAGEQAMDRSGVTTLVVDLAGVQFMDSTGIGALVDLATRADDLGIAFRVRNPSRRVDRVLEMTGLAQHWTIVRD